MNKRIKQMTKQAGFSGREALDARLVQFAELIARDCINLAMERHKSEQEIVKMADYEDRCYFRGKNDGIEFAVDEIQEHYGVE